MAFAIINDPTRRGQLASTKVLFGEYSRYAVGAIHTRDDAVSYFVWDAFLTDKDGIPEVIRQEPTLTAALAGLPDGDEVARTFCRYHQGVAV